jgi:arylsulfatase
MAVRDSDIVLLTIDSLRADAVYGPDGEIQDELTTLKSIASEGTQFRNAWSTAPFTAASFPSIMSGIYRWSISSNTEGLEDDRPYIAEELSTRGYATAGFHSNANLHEQLGWGRGMDRFVSGGFEGGSHDGESNKSVASQSGLEFASGALN